MTIRTDSLLGIRFSLGVPLEDIFPEGDLHPSIRKLLAETFNAIQVSTLPIKCILRYDTPYPECFSLEEALVRCDRIDLMHPGTLLWMLRHFLGLLPLPLLPKYTDGETFTWSKMSDRCRFALECHAKDRRTNECIIDVLADELLRLPPVNLLLIGYMINFLRSLIVCPGSEFRFKKSSTLALANYFSPAIFVRPYHKKHTAKTEQMYRPLMLYFLVKWPEIQRRCVEKQPCCFVPLERRVQHPLACFRMRRFDALKRTERFHELPKRHVFELNYIQEENESLISEELTEEKPIKEQFVSGENRRLVAEDTAEKEDHVPEYASNGKQNNLIHPENAIRKTDHSIIQKHILHEDSMSKKLLAESKTSATNKPLLCESRSDSLTHNDELSNPLKASSSARKLIAACKSDYLISKGRKIIDELRSSSSRIFRSRKSVKADVSDDRISKSDERTSKGNEAILKSEIRTIGDEGELRNEKETSKIDARTSKADQTTSEPLHVFNNPLKPESESTSSTISSEKTNIIKTRSCNQRVNYCMHPISEEDLSSTTSESYVSLAETDFLKDTACQTENAACPTRKSRCTQTLSAGISRKCTGYEFWNQDLLDGGGKLKNRRRNENTVCANAHQAKNAFSGSFAEDSGVHRHHSLLRPEIKHRILQPFDRSEVTKHPFDRPLVNRHRSLPLCNHPEVNTHPVGQPEVNKHHNSAPCDRPDVNRHHSSHLFDRKTVDSGKNAHRKNAVHENTTVDYFKKDASNCTQFIRTEVLENYNCECKNSQHLRNNQLLSENVNEFRNDNSQAVCKEAILSNYRKTHCRQVDCPIHKAYPSNTGALQEEVDYPIEEIAILHNTSGYRPSTFSTFGKDILKAGCKNAEFAKLNDHCRQVDCPIHPSNTERAALDHRKVEEATKCVGKSDAHSSNTKAFSDSECREVCCPFQGSAKFNRVNDVETFYRREYDYPIVEFAKFHNGKVHSSNAENAGVLDGREIESPIACASNGDHSKLDETIYHSMNRSDLNSSGSTKDDLIIRSSQIGWTYTPERASKVETAKRSSRKVEPTNGNSGKVELAESSFGKVELTKSRITVKARPLGDNLIHFSCPDVSLNIIDQGIPLQCANSRYHIENNGKIKDSETPAGDNAAALEDSLYLDAENDTTGLEKRTQIPDLIDQASRKVDMRDDFEEAVNVNNKEFSEINNMETPLRSTRSRWNLGRFKSGLDFLKMFKERKVFSAASAEQIRCRIKYEKIDCAKSTTF